MQRWVKDTTTKRPIRGKNITVAKYITLRVAATRNEKCVAVVAVVNRDGIFRSRIPSRSATRLSFRARRFKRAGRSGLIYVRNVCSEIRAGKRMKNTRNISRDGTRSVSQACAFGLRDAAFEIRSIELSISRWGRSSLPPVSGAARSQGVSPSFRLI